MFINAKCRPSVSIVIKEILKSVSSCKSSVKFAQVQPNYRRMTV